MFYINFYKDVLLISNLQTTDVVVQALKLLLYEHQQCRSTKTVMFNFDFLWLSSIKFSIL